MPEGKLTKRRSLPRDAYEHTDTLPDAYVLVRDEQGRMVGWHKFPVTVRSLREFLESLEHHKYATVEVSTAPVITQPEDRTDA